MGLELGLERMLELGLDGKLACILGILQLLRISHQQHSHFCQPYMKLSGFYHRVTLHGILQWWHIRHELLSDRKHPLRMRYAKYRLSLLRMCTYMQELHLGILVLELVCKLELEQVYMLELVLGLVHMLELVQGLGCMQVLGLGLACSRMWGQLVQLRLRQQLQKGQGSLKERG